MSEHIKTPWGVSTWIEQPNNRTKPMIAAGGVTIAITHPTPICPEDECEANAKHIIHCVNNHERLVEALRDCLSDECDLNDIHNARALLAELDAGEGGE